MIIETKNNCEIEKESQISNVNKYNPITQGVIWQQLLIFFFPIMFGTFFQQIYNVADTIIVGRFVGTQALAAVGGSVFQLVNLLINFFIGLTSGAAVIVAQAYGAGNKKYVLDIIGTSFRFSILFGIIISIFGYFSSDTLIKILRTPNDAVGYSSQYLHIFCCGLIFVAIYNMGASVLRALGDSKKPLYILIISSITNVILDIILVVYANMGVCGVAIGTVISQGISAIITLVIFVRKMKEFKNNVPQKFNIDLVLLKKILKIGLPVGIESVMYNICNMIIIAYVNTLGTKTAAAWGTLGKIDAFFWMIINAFSISVMTFIGQNYGAGYFDRMKKSIRWTFIMCTTMCTLILIIVYTYTYPVYKVFTEDSDVIEIGVHMSRFLMPTYMVYIIIAILSGALKGIGNVYVPMFLTCGGVCGFRFIWLFGIVSSHMTIDMILLSYPISYVITAILFIIYYYKKFPRERFCNKNNS